MVWDKIKEIVGSIKNCPQMVPFSLIFKHLYQYTFSQQNRAIVELYPQQPLYYYIKKLNSLKEMFKHYSKYGPVFVTDYKNIASNISKFIKINRFFNSRKNKKQ